MAESGTEDEGVILMADTGRKWQIYQDKRGEWRWRCLASNGKLVGASSQGYKSKEDCVQTLRVSDTQGSAQGC